MDRESLAGVDRVHHGGAPDAEYDFSANTNPRTPAGTEEVYEAAFEASRRYPDDDYDDFRTAAAEAVSCRPEAVVPTPGGLAAIRLAVATGVSPDASVLLPAPSFSEYAREVRLQGGQPQFCPHDQILDADPTSHTMAVVCTPNNPTGEAADPDALRTFADRCRAAETTLLVDEAFLGFTDLSSMAGEPGVLVARSLTKLFGLPGIRAGYLVASGERSESLRGARRAWNLSTPAARVGTHCLRQREFVAETRRRVRTERERLRDALATRYDIDPSDAPFLLLDVVDRDVDAVCARAADDGVAIRDARTFRGLDSHVRVAVKDEPANNRLLEAMDVRDRA